jgi:mxaJ protein
MCSSSLNSAHPYSSPRPRGEGLAPRRRKASGAQRSGGQGALQDRAHPDAPPHPRHSGLPRRPVRRRGPLPAGGERGFLALAIALLLSGAAEARTLRVCADPNNLPFSNERGEGFENRIVSLVAEELGATIEYTWRAQRRGFLRETLWAEACDLVPGLPSNLEGVRTTAPYYRSTYVFATRADGPTVASLNDAQLRDLVIGVQLIGDDGANAPPAHALSRRGIVDNVRGYSVYGDYREPNPPARIIEAVAKGDIDVAAVWGPLAGYFATRQAVPIRIAPVRPAFDGPQLPMVWDISMAVRKEDQALRHEIDAALERRRADIDAILAAYGVPRLDGPMKRAKVR